MSYFDKIAQEGESVRYRGRLSFVIFVRSWLWLALLLGILYVYYIEQNTGETWSTAVLYAAALVFLIFLFSFLSALLLSYTTEIIITDRRIIYKTGFIRRRTLEMNMSKVESVDVRQSILGRIFNYGTIMIRGIGSTYDPLGYISAPLAFRRAIIAG